MAELVPLSYPGTNLIYVLKTDPPLIVKVFLPKIREGKWKLFRYRLLSAVGYPTPMAYRGSAERCAYERGVLEHWAAAGYRVPQVRKNVTVPISVPRDEYLALEFIPGPTLFEELSDPGVTEQRKIELLGRLFVEMSVRHNVALGEKDPLLIQYNPNLRNVIVSNGDFYHIDFEVRRWLEPLVKSIAREVVTLATLAANAIGPNSLTAVTGVVFRAYGDGKILDRIIHDANISPWQRKKLDGIPITRHKIAAALREIKDGEIRGAENRI